MLAYNLKRIPESTGNVAECAIWHLRGSLDKMPVFLRCLKLLGRFNSIGILYSSIHIDRNH